MPWLYCLADARAAEAGADPSKADGVADANEEEEEPGSWALAEAKARRGGDMQARGGGAGLRGVPGQGGGQSSWRRRAKLENKVLIHLPLTLGSSRVNPQHH